MAFHSDGFQTHRYTVILGSWVFMGVSTCFLKLSLFLAQISAFCIFYTHKVHEYNMGVHGYDMGIMGDSV